MAKYRGIAVEAVASGKALVQTIWTGIAASTAAIIIATGFARQDPTAIDTGPVRPGRGDALTETGNPHQEVGTSSAKHAHACAITNTVH